MLGGVSGCVNGLSDAKGCLGVSFGVVRHHTGQKNVPLPIVNSWCEQPKVTSRSNCLLGLDTGCLASHGKDGESIFPFDLALGAMRGTVDGSQQPKRYYSQQPHSHGCRS